jgi:hypothetical protein
MPLIILIRVSSFPPWVYSNTLFAVSLLNYYWHSPESFVLEHSAGVIAPVLHSDLFCPPKGHGLCVRRISYC